MSLPISRKVEKAITGWLPAVLDIDGMNYFEGHEKAESVTFPALIVYAEGSAPFPDMPAECGVRAVRLRCKFMVDSDTDSGSPRSDVDLWKQKLEAAMADDLESLQAALNKPASGPDARPVQAIHFHYVEMADDPSDRNETDWIEDLSFNVTCELLDS